MSDVINGIYARATNDAPEASGYATASATVEPDEMEALDPAGVELAEAEPAEPTELAELTASDQAEEDTENTGTTVDAEDAETGAADDQADDDVIVEEEPAVEIAAEVSGEVSGEAVATDADDAEVAGAEVAGEEVTEDAESLAGESDDVAVAVAETDEDGSDEVEPAPAQVRPAAGARGTTTVGDGVVVKVVDMVVRRIEGVHSLGDEGISVGVAGDVATIEVSLAVEFGHAVKALAEQIRIDVIGAVEQFLSLDVAVVDVHVVDIHLPDAA